MLTASTASALQAEKKRQMEDRLPLPNPSETGQRRRRIVAALAAGLVALVFLGASTSEPGNDSPGSGHDVGNHPIVDVAPVGEPQARDDFSGGKAAPLIME